jgi:hypothetical protein
MKLGKTLQALIEEPVSVRLVCCVQCETIKQGG